jgi:hypothetical protein
MTADIGWLLPGTAGNQLNQGGVLLPEFCLSNLAIPTPASGWRRLAVYSDFATFRIFRIPWPRIPMPLLGSLVYSDAQTPETVPGRFSIAI